MVTCSKLRKEAFPKRHLAQVEMYKRLEKAAGEDAEVGDPRQRFFS